MTSYKHFITCCNPITNCFIIKHFFFSRYRKRFISDVISAATFFKVAEVAFLQLTDILSFIPQKANIQRMFMGVSTHFGC